MMKIFFILLISFAFSGFSANPSSSVRVGLVLDKGGRDDKSFNASAFKGAQEAKEKFGIQLKVVESSDDTAIEPSLRTLAQKGYQLVIGIGFVQGVAVKKIASEFPKTNFLIVDTFVDLPNVRSVIFNEHEGSFLVGVIAALKSQTKKVGFVGGMDIPLIRRFELGYRSGAKWVDPKVEVISNFVGASSDAWKNPTKGKELALSQYGKNVDIIFAAAGSSGLGVFDAAEEKNKFAIGVDSNQNWIKPGKILTSMLKRVDLAVLDAIQSEVNHVFTPGKYSWGLKEKAIDFALDEHNRKVLSETIEAKANDVKDKIIKNQIPVPDYYLKARSGT